MIPSAVVLTAAQEQSAVDVAARQLEQQDPGKNGDLRITVTPYRDEAGYFNGR